MGRKIASLLLVAAAFGIGIVVADHSTVESAGAGNLSGRLATVCLIALTGISVYLWYLHVLGQAKQRWADVLEMVDGEFSQGRVAVRGVDHGTPVFVRIDSEAVGDSEATSMKALAEATKYHYAVTMAFPVSGDTNWSVIPATDGSSGLPAHSWNVVTEDLELKKKFEEGGISQLLAECDETARLVCNAKVGEVTLVYSAPDTNYCPDPNSFQKELELLRTAVGLWNQNTRSTVAA